MTPRPQITFKAFVLLHFNTDLDESPDRAKGLRQAHAYGSPHNLRKPPNPATLLARLARECEKRTPGPTFNVVIGEVEA